MKKNNKLMLSLMVSTTLLSGMATPVMADTFNINNGNNQENVQQVNNNNNSQSMASSQSQQTGSVKNNGGNSVQKHELSQAYVVYGAGLSQNEQQQVGNVLGVDSNFDELTATANDYREYIDNSSSDTTNAEMISSVALEPTDPGSGVKVNIKDFNGQNNITQVTAQQYAMVATMAGVKDMNIIVTANRPVSGQSALTGVYVALAKDGITLNSQNTAVANDMLNATQGAVSQNNNDPKYAGKLSNAVMQTAQQVAKNKQKGDTMNTQQVQNDLNKNLQKQGIQDKTPQQTINNITNVLVNKFQNAPVAKNAQFIDNAENTVNNIEDNIKDGAKSMFGMKDFKNELPSKNWFVQKWTEFKNWVNGLIHGNDNNATQDDDNSSQN